MQKFYLFLISLCLLCDSFAQTAIDPVTSGGFDQGNTFAANGWTVVNSSANKWVVGTGADPLPPSSPNTAYISIDGNPTNYSYDNTTAHISHFYQQVTLPANAFNIALSFQLKGSDQFLQDGLEIYADPSLTIPVADALPGGSAELAFVQFDQNPTYTGQNTTLDPLNLAGKTFFIIFTWINDGDGIGDDPPASVDDISLTYCIKATNYAVTGGGGFCTGNPGVSVGLAGSTIGISYQLYNNGIPVGNPVDGTGSPIDFGLQNVAGNYTVVGTSGCGYTYPMPGSVNVIENSLPVPSIGSNAPICSGSTLNLTSSASASYNWTGPNSFTSLVQDPSITNVTTAASGTYTISVTDGNGCSAQASTNVIITPSNTATLTSLPNTDAQTICINTPIANITYSTTGATGIANDGVAGANGLPSGVSAHWASNTITISGTPTTPGLFNYSITLLGGCPSTINGSINVITQNTITLTSVSGSDAQSVCTNFLINNITYSTNGATGITNDGVSGANGLPAGVSAHWASNTITISGTPTASGIFNYTIPLTGGCGTLNATGTITVTVVNTVSAASSAPTVCINTSLTNIIHTTTGATGIINDGVSGANGLPAGVSADWASNTITISGTPTASGIFSYTIPLTGGCGTLNATGTITVTVVNTVSAASSAPTVCINTSLTNIIHTTTGATGIINDGVSGANGLPAGVSAHWASNTITISGTPTASGIFSYTIPLTGGCGTLNATGTITVTVVNTVSAASSAPTVCINTSLTNIIHTTTGATGIINDGVSGANGLPAGVSAHWASNTITISGTPTASGIFSYTIPLTGGCGTLNATGTITVAPVASVTLTSGVGTNIQTVCNGSSITDITYIMSNGTGFSITGLPSGLMVTPGIGTFTISGAPSQTGVFAYTITITGGCTAASASGTITVNAQAIVLTSATASPSVCANAPMADIIYTIGGTANNVSVSGLPSGISGTISGNIFTINGTPTDAPGNYNYTVTTSGTSCTPVIFSGIITITASPIGGSVSSVSICSSGGGSFSGQTGTITGWEYSSDNGTTWVPIVNTTATQAFTNVTIPTLYRAVVSNGCSNVTSSIATVGIHNYWVGTTSSDWNIAGNWSDGQIPSISCPDVYIPSTINNPILSGGATATITNLHIFAGATLTISGSGIMQVAGTISNNGFFDVTSGTLELNGTGVSQNIDGNTFKNNVPYTNNTVKNLIISNNVNVANTPGDTLNITGTLSFGTATSGLNTGDNITLKSSQTATSNVGMLAPGNTINGDVTVERYIATGTAGSPEHPKSWQLLAIPTQGQTINQSWMEGSLAPNDNLHPGFGTQITGTGAGFDLTTSAPSMKTYDYLSNTYIGVPGTAISIYNQKGYLVFVRGDRSVITPFAPATPTVLRTKGTLFTPANPPLTSTVTGFAGGGYFQSIGNPYASAIDMRNITRTGGVQEFIQVWDPRLGGINGYGAFQTFSFDVPTGNYIVTPGGGTYGAGGSPNNYIQSGQAFFMQAFNTSGTVSFTENAKASGSALVTTPFSRPQPQSLLRTTLNALNTDGSTILLDGVLNNFDAAYSNNIDQMDARKQINTGENLSIRKAGKLLIIERRQPLTPQDTIFLNLTTVSVRQYQFHFDAGNLGDNLQGFLEDNYTHTRTPLNMNGGTDVAFTIVNAPGGYAADRFRIVFATLGALPVTFTSIKATRQDKDISVEWRVNNEVNIKQYEVEKSTDGNHFTTMAVEQPTNNNGGSAIYVALDNKVTEGYNYYRVKSVDVDGKTAYTNVVKVLIGSLKQDITIYPNPITDGMIHLQLMNQPEGKYAIRLLNKLGQTIVNKQVTHAGGNATELINWDYNLAHGIYQLEVTKPDGTVKDINVLY